MKKFRFLLVTATLTFGTFSSCEKKEDANLEPAFIYDIDLATCEELEAINEFERELV